MRSVSVLPVAGPRRLRAAGLLAGAPLSRVEEGMRLTEALGLVAPDLVAAEMALRSLVMSDVAAVPAIATYLLDAGGKRVRPALTALGARAAGIDRDVSRLMCVGELLHLGSLLHDDVVDEAELRRDQLAAHRVYGSAATVLAGDFCLARAVLLATEEGGYEVVRALGGVITEMAEGEVLQLERAGRATATEEQYVDVVNRKTAALIAWCVSAPALAWRPELAPALARFGRAIGIAFQITDDVLDYAPDTGKTPGSDLRDGKLTLPVILAMDHVPDLAARIAGSPRDGADVRELMEEVRRSGALDAALDRARGWVEIASDALGELPEGQGRDALAVLARHLVERAR